MGSSILEGKRLLAVDDEPDILDVLEENLEAYGVKLDKAQSFEGGIQRLTSYTYDLVILDIMGVRGFELLEFAVMKQLPVVMLTAHALSLEALSKSIDLGARAYLPKDEIDRIVPFLEDVLNLSYESAWLSVFKKLGGYFGKRFGPEWRTSEREFMEKFQKDPEMRSTIIES
ncbi:MAG: response regulator [Desulfomonile tiedjei]|uniref:Response regulator n=1 Tax=Desulfomonile tiedjei TaxID=2358 RepID=A0A9D6V592_9BACT|nr:response regulator [Desulfomonile tiedjei]